MAMGQGKSFSARIAAGDDPGPAIVCAVKTAECFARDAQLDQPGSARLLVVVEELVSNVLRHGGSRTDIEFVLALEPTENGVSFMLEDTGSAFDSTAERNFGGPDSETGGGVGLALVREWASDFAYKRKDERNCLELILRMS